MQFILTKDTLTPSLREKMRQVARPRTILEAGAKAGQVDLVKHLRELQARGNEMGWPSNQFFSGGPTSVEKNVGVAQINDQGFLLSIADPRFVHRLTGGTVTPKRAKLLAIPLTAEAYALSGQGSLRESAAGLKVIQSGKGLMLARIFGKSAPEFLFRLVRSVTHRPKPNEAPDTRRLAAKIRGAMERAAALLLKK